eukprot:SM000173S03018  [mRNA]  locus=s173:304447:304997:+ [translate_table: standard]
MAQQGEEVTASSKHVTSQRKVSHDVKKVNAVVKGTVQGVFFRKWTEETALRLGLDGWVRNRSDGTVEAVLSGPPAAVDLMLKLCHEGPAMARVSAVDVSPWDETVSEGFELRPTS